MKLSDAKRRTLSYMADNAVDIHVQTGTGWTDDKYCWPVSTLTVVSLRATGLIEPVPSNAAAWVFRITAAGRAALKEDRP